MNDIYNSISQKIYDMTTDISPYLMMTSKSNKFQFDLPTKTKFDADIKQLSKNAKQITNEIRDLRRNVQKWDDALLRPPFEQKIKILINNHHQNLKSLVMLTESYPEVPNEYEHIPSQTYSHAENSVVIYVNQDVYSKAKEVTELTSSIMELKEMFQEIATLLEYQHEQLGLVEIQIDDAQVRTNTGNKELKSAIILKKKNRMMCCCILFVVIIVFAGAVAVLSALF